MKTTEEKIKILERAISFYEEYREIHPEIVRINVDRCKEAILYHKKELGTLEAK